VTFLRRVLLLDHPQETRFFAVIGALGVVLGIAYWFVSYEVAGTVLLVGFGLASGLAAARLFVTWRGREVARRVRAGAGEPSARGPDEGEGPGGGLAGVDRPFLDESGRLPAPTLAPLALGLGISLALTAVVFGPWLLVAAVIPLVWGCWAWFAGAREEFEAAEGDEMVADPAERDAIVADPAGQPPTMQESRLAGQNRPGGRRRPTREAS